MRRIRNLSLRELAPWLIGAAVVVVGAGVLISTSHTTVTRARLERNLPLAFSNLYVQQADLLGHKGVTVKSLHAQAQCDKGGPNVRNSGPGADWICYMSWNDPNVDETLMPGKFEVSAHSNNCYTAGGPSKLVGLLTITDKHGKDISNPVFEFDSCFDPHGSNKPTGVNLAPTSTSPTSPSAISIGTKPLVPDPDGVVNLPLTCPPGQEGCGGTIAASLAGRHVDTVTYALKPDSEGRVQVSLDPAQAAAGGRLVLSVVPVIGDAAAPKVSVVVRGS